MKQSADIAVSYVRFMAPQDGPGMKATGSAKSEKVKMTYVPSLRAILAEAGGERAFIPIERVMYWVAAE